MTPVTESEAVLLAGALMVVVVFALAFL